MIAQSAPLSTTVPGPLFLALFWLAVAACAVAQFFILRAVWRVVPSVTGSPEVPAPRRAPEMAWALLPTLLMAALFVGAWRASRVVPASATPTVSPILTPSATPTIFPVRA